MWQWARCAHSIKGGIKYLDWLRDRFDDALPISERLWFTLASYNAGVGHVHDARRLARELGHDADKWFGHTEEAMLLLSKKKYARKARYGFVNGEEPVNYVRDIRQRFEAYLDLSRTTAEAKPQDTEAFSLPGILQNDSSRTLVNSSLRAERSNLVRSRSIRGRLPRRFAPRNDI